MHKEIFSLHRGFILFSCLAANSLIILQNIQLCLMSFFLKKNDIACPFVYFFLPILGLTKENCIPYELIKLLLEEHPCFFVNLFG